MSGDFFVFLLFLATAVFCLIAVYLHRWLLYPLLFAYLFRCFLVMLDYTRVFRPPGATADATRFTWIAHEYSLMEWPRLIDRLRLFTSDFYPWLGGALQKIVGQSELMLISTSFFFGHVIVVVISVIVYQLWGRRQAVMAAYIMALYPFAAFNSILAMREEVSIMFFSIGLYFFIRWIRGIAPLGLLSSGFFFVLAISFHPGWVGAFVGIAIYLLYFLYRAVKTNDGGRVTKLHAFKVLLALGMLLGSVGMIALGDGISLGKGVEIGGDGESDIGDAIEERFNREARGGSAYPGFIAQGNPYTQPWLIPARIVYFHFSPFPWDLRSPRQILGVVSSVLYAFLAWRLYRGWHQIKYREEALALLLIFGAITFIFAIGVTNIGTAIRHKTKLLGLFVILAAASFDRVRFKLWK